MLVTSLREVGFPDVAEPSGTMFVWTRLPERLRALSSVDATVQLIERAHVGVAPGSGFGEGGEGYIRFALIEDPPRIAEACNRLGAFLR